jgi:hypothetical protein
MFLGTRNPSFLYEMLYGYTPSRGETRQRTFANILHKDMRFPASIEVSKFSFNFYGWCEDGME